MRSIAGGLVVGSGAFLFGTGAFAVNFAYAHNAGFYATYGGWAVVIGVVLLFLGLGLIAYDLRSGRPPTTLQ
jgi:hypothetical protein